MFDVISLCDGISTGQLALKGAGVKIRDYYASEIDDYAVKVAMKNFPNTIQIGDLTKISYSEYTGIIYSENIDFGINSDELILLSGTPCQRLSHAGQGCGLHIETDNLFYKFAELKQKLNPKYFLFENVPTTKQNIEIINNSLGCEPIMINSSMVSAQNRKRLYWTNIEFEMPKDENILLQDILLHGEAHRRKSKTVRVGGRGSKDRHEWDIADKSGRTYDIIEAERLQTLPDNYTKADGVSNAQRFKCVGNGWTKKVVENILKGVL